MPARLFRRIQSFFSRLNKTVLLTAVIFITVGSLVTSAIANSTIDTYSHLFDGVNFSATANNGTQTVSFATSGLADPGTAGDLTKDAATNTVNGVVLNIGLGFSATDNDILKANWNDVSSSNDTFLIRLCDKAAPTNCWLNTVPYYAYLAPDAPTAADVAIFEHKNKNVTHSDEYSNVNIITNFPVMTDPQHSDRYTFTRNIAGGKDEGTLSDFTALKLSSPSTVEATLWYCAAGPGATAYSGNGNNDTMATFGQLCGGDTYFRIGSPLNIAIPASAQAINAQTNTQKAVSTTTGTDNLPVCGIGVLGSTGTINGCAARIAYGIYYLSELVAALFGQLFDFFIGYSVSSSSYTYGFAVTGWKLVRDISNIFFILIMVWTGFSAVFDTSNTSMKKVVPALIVNALLINFSLFATRVVIDISNITARMFYSQMLVCEEVNKDSSGHCIPGKTKTGTGGYWPLSEAIVGAFNPQKIFQASILQQTTIVAGDTASDFNAQTVTQTKPKLSATDSANYFAAICLVGAFIMVIIAVMFFKVAFLFVGRVVGLYVCMIFSPFAFLSRDIPMLGSIERLRWGDWVKELTNYALLAPIFIFFLYIIYTLLSSNFAQEIGSTILSPGSTNVFELIISTLVPMAIIYYLIKAAKDAAEKYSGELGKSIQKFGEQATGLAIGAATGGAAYVGTRAGSRITKVIGEKTGLTGWAASNADKNMFARWTNNALSKSQTGSWDVRQTTAAAWAGKVFKTAGIGNNIGQYAGIGEKYFEGGFKGQQKRRQEKIKKNINDRINYAHLTDDQAKAIWEKHKAEKIEEESEKNWKKHIDEEADVKIVAEKMKDLTDKEAVLTKEKADIEKELNDARVAGNTAAIASLIAMQKDRTAELGKVQAEKNNVGGTLTTLRTEKINDLKKDGKYKDSEAYKKAGEKQREEFEKYGDIKNGKDFTAAMRREYALDLRNDSFWMKDGKQREGFFAELMGERLKFEQEALDEATKSYIKQGKESKASQLKKKLQQYDDTVKKALIARGKTAEQIEKMDMAEKQESFKEHVVEAQANYDTANAQFKKAERDFNDDKITEKQFKDASRIKKQTEDELNSVKNLWTNREKAQDDLQKEIDKENPQKDTKGKDDAKK